MKNKGYTLLELLGVIVILAILVTLVFPSVINFIKKGNDTKDSITNGLLISAVDNYINDNSSKLYLTNSGSYCVPISTLEKEQYLLIELEDENLYSKSIKVTYDDEKNYEIVDDCTICNLVVDADKSGTVTIGDKYQCKVKDDMEEGFENGYFFYVLSQNNDGTINLIMDRNMYYDSVNDVGKVATATNKGLVAWYSLEQDHSYGPVTAMTYLHNATKDWNNVPNMKMNYEDENIDYYTQQKGIDGYGSIKTTGATTIITSKNNTETGRIENLKARLPRYNEVHGEGKCLTYEENGNNNGSCPLYLINYLNSSSHITIEGLQNISGINGYWTLSSRADDSRYAWEVYRNGCLSYSYVVIDNNDNYAYNGVRPVINVNLKNIDIIQPTPFSEDSWETIVANVKSGNLSKYKVGDTKEIELTGFTNEEKDEVGNKIRTYTVRIANTSTPDECKTEGFSQTACGFVIEFVDIISEYYMNTSNTNKGGYPASSMYTYIQSDIYNALPEELRKNIIDTTVVSGYGSGDAPNKVTTDKIYLLSKGEVWAQDNLSSELTRQLDYYKSIGVTADSYSGAIKKYNGNANYWWLRSAYYVYYFYSVSSSGNLYLYKDAYNTIGVSVAFRIG